MLPSKFAVHLCIFCQKIVILPTNGGNRDKMQDVLALNFKLFDMMYNP